MVHNESVPNRYGKTTVLLFTTCTSVVEHYSEAKTNKILFNKLFELEVFQFKFSTKFIVTRSTHS